MKFPRFFTRSIAFLTLTVFAGSLIIPDARGYHGPPIKEVKGFPALPLEIPSGLGAIKDYFPARSKEFPFILHVQDAHAVPAAQAKIRDILKWLQTQGQRAPMLIALEGAKGDLHPEYLNFFKEYPAMNEAIVQNLAAQGELTGAELFAWGKYKECKPAGGCDSSVFFRGVENAALYRRNLRDYRSLLFRQEKIRQLLEPLRRNLDLAQSRVLSAPVRRFLEERKRRKDGEYQTRFNLPQWDSYLRFLGALAKKELGIDLANPVEQIRFPHLTRLQAVQYLNSSLEEGRAQEEKKKFIAALREKAKIKDENILVDQLEALADQPEPRRVLEEAWNLAQAKGIALKSYPQFLKSTGRVILSSEIEADELAKEFDRLEKWLLGGMAKRPEEKRFIRLLEDFNLFEKLLQLKLAREDWLRFLKRKDGISVSAIQGRLRAFRPDKYEFCHSCESRNDNKNLTQFFHRAMKFYADAGRRDQVLLENTLKAARHLKFDKKHPIPLTVLVTGGFHSEGLAARMREKGIGYAVIAPNFHDPGSEALQAKVFKDENARLPYLKNSLLTKQEAIFLKQILETAAPKLAEIRSLLDTQIGVEISRAINRHQILSKKIRSAARSLPDTPSILLGIAPVKYTSGYPDRLDLGVNTVGDALLLQLQQNFDALRPLESKASSGNSKDFSIFLKASGLRVTVRSVQRLLRSVKKEKVPGEPALSGLKNRMSRRSEVRSGDEQANVRERFPELFSEASSRRKELIEKFEYSAEGVRAARIPREPGGLQQEAGFAILLNGPVFQQRVQNYSERLVSQIQDPARILYRHKGYRLALVARYTEETQAPLLSAEVLKRASEIAKEKLETAGIRQFSVRVTGMRDTTDGSIVLDVEKNKTLFDLRTLLYEALVKAVEEDEVRKRQLQGGLLGVRERDHTRRQTGHQFRRVLNQDRNISLEGVFTIARITPHPDELGTLLTDQNLVKLDMAEAEINRQLQRRPLIIPVRTIDLVEIDAARPGREYLEEMQAPAQIPLMPNETNSTAAKAAGEVYRIFKEDIQKDGFVNSGATRDFHHELFEKNGVVWNQVQASGGSTLEAVLIPLMKQLQEQALKWEQGTEAEEVPEWQRLFWSARIHAILWLISSYYPHLSGKAEGALEEEETALQRHFESFITYILMHHWVADFQVEKGKPVSIKEGLRLSTFMKTKPGSGLEGSGIFGAASMKALRVLLEQPELLEVFVTDALRVQMSSAIGSDGFARAVLHIMTMLHGPFYLGGQPPVVVQVKRIRGDKKLILHSVDLKKEQEIKGEIEWTKNGEDPLFYLKMAYIISQGISGTEERKDNSAVTDALWGAILEGLTGVRGMINSVAAIHGGGFLFTTNPERSYDPIIQVVVSGKRLQKLRKQMRLLDIGFKKPAKGVGSTMDRLANRALLFLINNPRILRLMRELRKTTRDMVKFLQADPVEVTQLAEAINNVQHWTNEAIQDDTPEPLKTFLDKIRENYRERTGKPLGILVQGAGPGGAVLLYGERMDIVDKIKEELIGGYIEDLKQFGLYDAENPPDFFDFQLTEQGQNVLRPVQENPVILEGEGLGSFLHNPADFLRGTIKKLGFGVRSSHVLRQKVAAWYQSRQKPTKISIRVLQGLNDEKNIQLQLDDLSGRSLGDFFRLLLRSRKRSEIRYPATASSRRGTVLNVYAEANPFRSPFQLFGQSPVSSPELLRNFSKAQIEGWTGRLRWTDLRLRYPRADAIRRVSEAAAQSLYGTSLWNDLPEPAAWRFLQLALASEDWENRSNPVLDLIRQNLGDYAPLLLNPGKASIHLIFPLSKKELPAGALAFLALAAENDRLSFILPVNAEKAGRLEGMFETKAVAQFHLPEKSREVLSVIGASPDHLQRAVKRIAGEDQARVVGILNESIAFLEALGYIRGKERLYADELDEDSAILLSAILLRERFSDPYSIKRIRRELQSRNIDLNAFVSRVGSLIEALRLAESMA